MRQLASITLDNMLHEWAIPRSGPRQANYGTGESPGLLSKSWPGKGTIQRSALSYRWPRISRDISSRISNRSKASAVPSRFADGWFWLIFDLPSIRVTRSSIPTIARSKPFGVTGWRNRLVSMAAPRTPRVPPSVVPGTPINDRFRDRRSIQQQTWTNGIIPRGHHAPMFLFRRVPIRTDVSVGALKDGHCFRGRFQPVPLRIRPRQMAAQQTLFSIGQKHWKVVRFNTSRPIRNQRRQRMRTHQGMQYFRPFLFEVLW